MSEIDDLEDIASMCRVNSYKPRRVALASKASFRAMHRKAAKSVGRMQRVSLNKRRGVPVTLAILSSDRR